jgi:DNA-binding response OmpR family regulator
VRVLLLEDDFRLRQAYGRRLRADGHAVDEAVTIAQTRASFDETQYDCAVLDRLVSDGDAIDLVSEMGAVGTRPPVLVLSGLGDGDSRVDGLAAGADDYVAKPVGLEELAMRVRKLIVRRSNVGTKMHVGRVSVDRSRRQVRIAGDVVHLSPTQYSVFEQLVINLDHVVDQGSLLEHCWDAQRDPFSNPLHSQVVRLRSIFRDHLRIETVRGAGYMVRSLPDRV